MYLKYKNPTTNPIHSLVYVWVRAPKSAPLLFLADRGTVCTLMYTPRQQHRRPWLLGRPCLQAMLTPYRAPAPAPAPSMSTTIPSPFQRGRTALATVTFLLQSRFSLASSHSRGKALPIQTQRVFGSPNTSAHFKYSGATVCPAEAYAIVAHSGREAEKNRKISSSISPSTCVFCFHPSSNAESLRPWGGKPQSLTAAVSQKRINF